MKKVIEKNKSLLILNCIFAVVVVAQETHLIDVFPIEEQWKTPIKAIILFSIAGFNAVKLTIQNLSDK
jgi:hypothetical protein